MFFRQQIFAGTLAGRGSIVLSAAITAGKPDWGETHIVDKAGSITKNIIGSPKKFEQKMSFYLLFVAPRFLLIKSLS